MPGAQRESPKHDARGFRNSCAMSCTCRKRLQQMADRTGLEPATSGVTGRHSNQLNYRSAACVLRDPHQPPPEGGAGGVRTCDTQPVKLELVLLRAAPSATSPSWLHGR